MYNDAYYNTFRPYKEIEHKGIDYTVCRKFDHISRYRGLRQVIHDPKTYERYITLEIQNAFTTNADIAYYEVPSIYVNRLDLISLKLYGSAHYGWVIAYMNEIQDGFSVKQGQKIKYIKNLTDLFNSGEMLAAIPAMQLNLGSE